MKPSNVTDVVTRAMIAIVQGLTPAQAREAAERVRGIADGAHPTEAQFIEKLAVNIEEFADGRQAEL